MNAAEKGNARDRRIALRFIILIGILSFFADFTYEGSRSVIGPYLRIGLLRDEPEEKVSNFVRLGSRRLLGRPVILEMDAHQRLRAPRDEASLTPGQTSLAVASAYTHPYSFSGASHLLNLFILRCIFLICSCFLASSPQPAC